MGERVVVTPRRGESDAGPAARDAGGGAGGAAGSASRAGTPRDPHVRLEYAKSDLNPIFPTFWKAVAWLRYVASEFAAAAGPFAAFVRAAGAATVARLGGRSQIIFAIGVACVLGAFGAGLSRDEAVTFWMIVGGLLIGLVLRVPLRP